ncbi:MAG: alpha/beta hydrolase, partial [Anaerolineae bacterium]|nr:alpha/beta hydrolase [Anaerolineae bacterium]
MNSGLNKRFAGIKTSRLFSFAVLGVLLFDLSISASLQAQHSLKVREGYLHGAEDVRLYYRVVGSTPDTIVAVHGGPGAGMNAFLPDLEPLAQSHTVIFYDQRGGGRSELPADTSRLDARFFVEDLDAVRHHFGLSRMKIVAHSFGAVLVARYIQSYPKRVERSVFMGATGPKRSEAAKLAQKHFAAMDSVTFKRYIELIQSLLAGTAANPIAACREYEKILVDLTIKRGEPNNWRGTTCEASPEAVAYYYRYTARITPATFGDWDFTTAFGDITAPLLVVYGAQDSLALPQQHAWAQAFPN